MNGRWKESENGIVTLPEDDADVFDIYVQSLYLGHVSQFNSEDADGLGYDVLEDLYMLTHKLRDVKGQNIVCRAIYDKVQAAMIKRGDKLSSKFVSLLENVYKVTTDENPIRRLLVDAFLVFDVRTEEDIEVLTNWCNPMDADIMFDLMMGLMKRKPTGQKLNAYHNYLEMTGTED
jgi:hypothetical protein